MAKRVAFGARLPDTRGAVPNRVEPVFASLVARASFSHRREKLFGVLGGDMFVV
jgi:hypothetical protein